MANSWKLSIFRGIGSYKNDCKINLINKFIECGSGEFGDNAVGFSNFFEVYSIENNESLHLRYKNRPGINHKLNFILGDGREELSKILTKYPNEQFVILLDDHNSHTSFITEEMNIIKQCSNRNDHVIIVDDMRYAGKGSYPTVNELINLAKNINKQYITLNTKIGADIHVIYQENNQE